jgi:hypothetical protein
MSYVAASTDVVFTTEPEPPLPHTANAFRFAF